MKLKTRDSFPSLNLTDTLGCPVELPPAHGLVHLQLRRFAGCPVCNVHLRSLVRGRDALEAAGIQEVIVFHSPAEQLNRYVQQVPFQLVADPSKRLYRMLGAETGLRSILDPRGWPQIVRSLCETLWRALRGVPAPVVPFGGPLGLPAEFLIGSDGRVVASKYGEYVDDQWTLDELLVLGLPTSAALPVPVGA